MKTDVIDLLYQHRVDPDDPARPRRAARDRASKRIFPMAWLLAQRSWIVPIPGTSKFHRLDENLGAATLQLSPDDLQTIADALVQLQVQGERYPAALQARVGR